MWQVASDIADTADEARETLSRATAGMSPEEAIAYEVLNTAFIPFVYLLNLDRVDSWLGDFLPALTEWASWLLQNNPDLLSAYFMFAGRAALDYKNATPVLPLLRALRESTVQVGAPPAPCSAMWRARRTLSTVWRRQSPLRHSLRRACWMHQPSQRP